MEKRIQNASLIMDASLGHCFVDGLEHRDATAIYNCLRAYAAIDNTKNVEEIFRTTIVAPLIQKIIPHGPSAMAAESSTKDLIVIMSRLSSALIKTVNFYWRFLQLILICVHFECEQFIYCISYLDVANPYWCIP
ncbi:hypothetical protein K1719_037537 [Acacia pycnantha]|nr:hypothetical protein K1719_037537 [Acacia pycnantha]